MKTLKLLVKTSFFNKINYFLYIDIIKYVFNRRSNKVQYSNTVIGTLAVDGWAVTFVTARRGLGRLGPGPVPCSLYQM